MNFNTPAPKDIVRWYRKGVPGGGQKDRIFDRLKAKLTGGTDDSGTSYFSMLEKKLSDKDADIIIKNMKTDIDGYPMLETGSTSGEDQRRYQEWIVERYLKTAGTEGFTDTSVAAPDDEEEQKEEVVEEEAEEIVEEAEEEVKENIEEAVEVVDEVIEEADVSEETGDISDITDILPQSFIDAVNQQQGTDYQKTKKSTGVSNTKILSTLVGSLQKIQGQLGSIDNELKKQNALIGAALGTTVSNLNQIETSHDGLNDRFDGILEAFEAQTALKKKELDDAETAAAIDEQDDVLDAAGTEGIGGKKGKKGKEEGGLSKYVGRIAKWLWKKFAPKWLRSRLRLLRMKFGPKNLKRRAGNFLNSQKKRAGDFLGNQKDRFGDAINRKKSEIGAKIGQAKGKLGDAITGAKTGAKKLLSGIKGQISSKANFLKGKGDDLLKGGKNLGQRALNSGKGLVDNVGKFMASKGARIGAKVGVATGKYGGRMIPAAGIAISAADAVDRTKKGDKVGAWLAGLGAASGTGAVVTAPAALSGVGVAAPAAFEATSAVADTALLIYDIFNAVTDREFEQGGLTKPGLAMLHGTEAIIPKDVADTNLLSPVGGALIGASANFLTQAGPAASLVAPMFKQSANALTKFFDVPTTLAQTNVGGSFAGIDTTIKNVKKKSEEENNEDPDEFGPEGGTVEEKMLDKMKGGVTGFFGGMLKLFGIRMPPEVDVNDDDGNGGKFGGNGKFIQGNSGASGGIHYHIGPGSYQDGNITSSAGNADARAVAEKVVKHFQGKKSIYIGRLGYTVKESDTPAIIKEKVKRGQEVHSSGRGSQGGIDLQIGGAYYPGAKVPFPLKTEGLKYRTGGFGVTAKVSGSNAFVAHGLYDENGKQAPQERTKMYGEGGDTPSVPTEIIVGDRGKEKVMKNLVASFKPVSDLLDAYNASTSTDELIAATRAYAPEVLMYDDEEGVMGQQIIVVNNTPPMAPMPMGGGTIVTRKPTTSASKTLLMQKLFA